MSVIKRGIVYPMHPDIDKRVAELICMEMGFKWVNNVTIFTIAFGIVVEEPTITIAAGLLSVHVQ